MEARSKSAPSRRKKAWSVSRYRTSSLSMYRRFVGAKREFSEKERAFFVNVDFVSHVAEVRLVICDLSASPYLDHAGSAQTSVADADWAISDRQRCEP